MREIFEALLAALELINAENVIKDNWLIFLIWTIVVLLISFSVCTLILKKNNKKAKSKIEALNEEIAKLTEKLNVANADNKRLRETIANLDEYSWIKGSNEKPKNYVAEDISDSLK